MYVCLYVCMYACMYVCILYLYIVHRFSVYYIPIIIYLSIYLSIYIIGKNTIPHTTSVVTFEILDLAPGGLGPRGRLVPRGIRRFVGLGTHGRRPRRSTLGRGELQCLGLPGPLRWSFTMGRSMGRLGETAWSNKYKWIIIIYKLFI